MNSHELQYLEYYSAYVLFIVAFLGNLAILLQAIYRKLRRRRRRALPRARVRALYKSGLGKVIKTRNVPPYNKEYHEKSDSSPIKPSGRFPEA